MVRIFLIPWQCEDRKSESLVFCSYVTENRIKKLSLVLSELKKLTYFRCSGYAGIAFTPFIDARQNQGSAVRVRVGH
jgi:hypothetical protein